MRLIKHLTTWLLLLTVLTASGVVSAKVASGSQNLSGGLYQGNVTANALTHQAKIEFSYDGASGSPVATKSGTWNQFQAATKGQFSSRAEAGKAWAAYKDANGIVTGSVRSQAVKSQYLKGLAGGGKSPKWMNQWLQKGKVPPGHEVDHIKPLSIGGKDASSNMRLLNKATHDTHHKFYRPWQ
ncbi:MAG: HNH endonuclease signature motif containing protein [Candidatus Sedimenticola sp. (ex Thyasira tokunagai)]